MKFSGKIIKNILQDAMVRIPFFISLSPTDTIAMNYDSYVVQKIEEGYFKGVLATHQKLYYESQNVIPVKTLIIVFQNTEFSKLFYDMHSERSEADIHMNKFVNTLVQVNAEINDSQESDKFKSKMYYCKDISDLQGLLYERGKVAVQYPDSNILREIITQISRLVVIEGVRAEEELKNKIIQEPVLQFLDHTLMSSENIFYRWRVYSYLQGDGDTNYRREPFEIVADRAVWYPPEELANQKYKYRLLNHQQRQYFTLLLHNLTTKKQSIEEAMAFCIKNMASFVDISCIISVELVNICSKPQVSEQRVLAMMFLVSDILFNSPWSGFRDVLGMMIPELIQRIRNSEMNCERLRGLLKIWEKRYIFEQQYLQGLFFILSQSEDRNRKIPLSISNDINEKQEDQIEEMVYRYGLPLNANPNQNRQNLKMVLFNLNTQNAMSDEPAPDIYDGEQLCDKDIQKIKAKTCKVINCAGATVKSLFEKNKTMSVSIDKQ